jgi:hypothetical protein
MHTGVLPLHALPAIHVLPTQNSGVLPSLHRLWPFAHPQVPFVQIGVSPPQAAPFCQVFPLQVCGVDPLHCFWPSLHATHELPTQTGVAPPQAESNQVF